MMAQSIAMLLNKEAPMRMGQSHRSVRERQTNLRVARWLTFTVVLLILYGSFLPFQFVSIRH
jgi:hypothetical protein